MTTLKIHPDLEAFFVSIAIVHGTNPTPKYGVERVTLSTEIAEVMANAKWDPELLKAIRRNYAELGGRLLDTDPAWFYTRLADSYLDWCYGSDAAKGAESGGSSAGGTSAHDPRVDPDSKFERSFRDIFGA